MRLASIFLMIRECSVASSYHCLRAEAALIKRKRHWSDTCCPTLCILGSTKAGLPTFMLELLTYAFLLSFVPHKMSQPSGSTCCHVGSCFPRWQPSKDGWAAAQISLPLGAGALRALKLSCSSVVQKALCLSEQVKISQVLHLLNLYFLFLKSYFSWIWQPKACRMLVCRISAPTLNLTITAPS